MKPTVDFDWWLELGSLNGFVCLYGSYHSLTSFRLHDRDARLPRECLSRIQEPIKYGYIPRYVRVRALPRTVGAEIIMRKAIGKTIAVTERF